jgi:tetrahydromethanopterin S-methyltransferase subunit C
VPVPGHCRAEGATVAAPQHGRPVARDRPVIALGLVAIGLAIGAAGIYLGDTDDAPGAALIGLLMIGSIVLGVRTGDAAPRGVRAWPLGRGRPAPVDAVSRG